MSTIWRFAAALVVGLGVTGCSDGNLTPEEALREWVADGEALVEERSFRALGERIADNYSDGRGNDKARLVAQLRAMTLSSASFETVTSVDAVEFYSTDAARVDLTVRFASIEGNLRGIDAGSYKVSLELAGQGDEWRVYSARWGKDERDMR